MFFGPILKQLTEKLEKCFSQHFPEIKPNNNKKKSKNKTEPDI